MFIALTGLVACGVDDDVVAEMERSLYASQGAIAAELIAAEVLLNTHTAPDDVLRHGDSCGCPCIERDAATAPYTVSLDYADTGCLPLSGLIPSLLSGHAAVDWDGSLATVTFDGLEVGLDYPVSGTLSGSPASDGSAVQLEGDLVLGDWQATLDTRATLHDDAILLDGTVEVGGTHTGVVTFEAMSLRWRDIAPPCPAPVAGASVLTGAQHAVRVDYADPGDGYVTVTRGNRHSDGVDFCAYRTALF